MNPAAPSPSAAVRKAGLLLPVLRRSAESWGNHHCAGELRRAIALIEDLSAPAAAVGGGSQVDHYQAKMREILCKALDADISDDETLWVLVNRAANALYWRGKEIEELRAANVATPAAPVGGFVVDKQQLADHITDWLQKLAPIEYGTLPRLRNDIRVMVEGMKQLYLAPAAQPSAIIGPAQTESEFQRIKRVVGDIRRGVEVQCVNDNPAAQSSAKDGVRGIPMGGQNFVHNEKKILDAINTHEFAKEVVAESFSGLTPREATTAASLVDGVTDESVEAKAEAMFNEYKDAMAAPWDRQWIATRGYWRKKARAALEAAIGREVGKP